MAKFAYNNTKNTSTGQTFFELNNEYHLCVYYKKDLDPHSKLKTMEKLSFEFQELITVCQKNFHHIQKFQKQTHNKGIKY